MNVFALGYLAFCLLAGVTVIITVCRANRDDLPAIVRGLMRSSNCANAHCSSEGSSSRRRPPSGKHASSGASNRSLFDVPGSVCLAPPGRWREGGPVRPPRDPCLLVPLSILETEAPPEALKKSYHQLGNLWDLAANRA